MAARGDTLATRVALLEDKVRGLTELISGGPNTKWEQSIRGRLHEVQNVQVAAKVIETASKRIEKAHRQRLDTWLQIVLAISAVVAAVSPYVIAYH